MAKYRKRTERSNKAQGVTIKCLNADCGFASLAVSRYFVMDSRARRPQRQDQTVKGSKGR
ncbi:hypothetical protein RRF57_006781 [Xylaria bambusicola]|uniref:Uncharacterized protein n=1 Tax=Xylaria bambusicola TaxID=326684 RepID=A0AAN7UQU8_9PEZI